jgi:hypothetical protein
MERTEFIKTMESKGFDVNFRQENYITLSQGMTTIGIYKTHLIHSSPRGNFKYLNFDDFNIGKTIEEELYSLRD